METKEVEVSLRNFKALYNHYQKDLTSATEKWRKFLNRSSDHFHASTDRDEIRSIVDEIFLECVTNWSKDKQKNCKFRSFLFTQLNRRLLNHSKKIFGRQKQIPVYNLIPYSEIFEDKENYPEIVNRVKPITLDGLDEIHETDILDSELIRDRGLDSMMSPVDKLLYKKECLSILRQKNHSYNVVMDILSHMVEQDDPNDKRETLISKVSSSLDIPERQVRILLYRMKKDLILILKDFNI